MDEASGDLAVEFQSHQGLFVDAARRADREAFERSLQACGEIAERIAAPACLWRAHSMRAMSKIIQGRFAEATRLLKNAEAEAVRANDGQAKVTIAVQRFYILCDWNSAHVTPMAAIRRQLDAASAGPLAGAMALLRPAIEIFAAQSPEAIQNYVSDQDFIRSAIASKDNFYLVALSELALKAEDPGLAGQTFNALLGSEAECAITGSPPYGWAGPVALQLGRIAIAWGRFDEARHFLAEAFHICHRMDAHPYLARVHQAMLDLARTVGDRKGVQLHAERAQKFLLALHMHSRRGVLEPEPDIPGKEIIRREPGFSIREKGGAYEIAMDGASTSLKASKGLTMLCHLVGRPGQAIHALELSGDDADVPEAGQAQASEHARRKAAERARVNVQRSIRDAIARIGQQLPVAGSHLEKTVKTGAFCKYTPE